MGTKVQPIKKVLNESIETNVINDDIVQNFNNFDRVALTRFRMARTFHGPQEGLYCEIEVSLLIFMNQFNADAPIVYKPVTWLVSTWPTSFYIKWTLTRDLTVIRIHSLFPFLIFVSNNYRYFYIPMLKSKKGHFVIFIYFGSLIIKYIMNFRWIEIKTLLHSTYTGIIHYI